MRNFSSTFTQLCLWSDRRKTGKEAEAKVPKCDPTTINLADYPQWVAETGYWIGEYTFLNGNGTHNVSPSWPYPCDSYKGFITGNIKGNAYRQRNVFFYPPQKQEVCNSYEEGDLKVVGSGICGQNGNTKIFFADQNATTCDNNGNIEGLYAGVYHTTTQLIGENALLYQVMYNSTLIQSQLTTITSDASGKTYRTRTAQGFDLMTQTSNWCSYYRERKVNKEEFYNEFNAVVIDYKVMVKDLCKTDSTSEEEIGSLEKCTNHLESSFSL